MKADALKFTQIVGTQLGTLLGTPQYMSPEQVRGSANLDHRTDLWALAIIACECLTGRYPFPGTTIGDLAVQICTEKPEAPSSLGPVPAGFDQWFFKGTSRKPSRRFASAEEMAAALDQILTAAEQSRPTATTFAAVLRAKIVPYTALASGLRDRIVAGVQSERWRLAKPLWSRQGLFVTSLVIAVCALAISALRHRDPANAEREPGQALQALAAAPPERDLQPLSTIRVDTLPIAEPEPGDELGPEAIPSEPAAETGPSPPAEPTAAPPPAAPAKASARRPRNKSAQPPPIIDADAPVAPVTVAMERAGARLARGFGTTNERKRGSASPAAGKPSSDKQIRPAGAAAVPASAATSTSTNASPSKSSPRPAAARLTAPSAAASKAPPPTPK